MANGHTKSSLWPVLLFLCGGLLQCERVDGDSASLAVVRGSVTRGAGEPVPGVQIDYSLYDVTHGRELFVDTLYPNTTGLAGGFERTLGFFLYGPFHGHLHVLLRPPSSSGLADSVVDAGLLRFQFGPGRVETLTVRINYPAPTAPSP